MEFKYTNLPIEYDYPKIIRDKLPGVIKAERGVEVEQRKAKDDKEFLSLLLKKLIEESSEAQYSLVEGKLREELVDILEIIHAIMELEKIDQKELDDIRKEKLEQYGGFSERTVLISKPKPKS